MDQSKDHHQLNSGRSREYDKFQMWTIFLVWHFQIVYQLFASDLMELVDFCCRKHYNPVTKNQVVKLTIGSIKYSASSDQLEWKGNKISKTFSRQTGKWNVEIHSNNLDYYCRYMNDTLIVCDKRIDKHKLLNGFNNVYSANKFTSSKENENSLAFLDVLLSRRTDGSIKRNVFLEIIHG